MKKLNLPKPYQILNKALQRKQKKIGGYSKRNFARDMGLSATFLSKVLTGKKVIPSSRVKTICRILEMDINAEHYLMQAILFHSLPSDDLREMAFHGTKVSRITEYELQPRKKFSVLKDWYTIAILDLLTCEFEATVKNIARKMNLTLEQTEQALKNLATEGLASEDNGLWSKTDLKVSFPTTKLQTEVRDFHKQMIEKAYKELSKITPTDFEQRLISGMTIAVDQNKLEQAKKIIFAALGDVADCLSDGTCKEVYQFNVQLFPLTKVSKMEVG